LDGDVAKSLICLPCVLSDEARVAGQPWRRSSSLVLTDPLDFPYRIPYLGDDNSPS